MTNREGGDYGKDSSQARAQRDRAAPALHAIRPIVPGRETYIAVFFGLIHGLAFAATLDRLGLGWWERVAGILAFNLGIETMQLILVTSILPSLLLLSRTAVYALFRVAAAVFAARASLAWTLERVVGIATPTDAIVNALAHRAIWIAIILFAVSLASGSMRLSTGRRIRAPDIVRAKSSQGCLEEQIRI